MWKKAKIIYIKTDDIYNDIAEDVEKMFETSNYQLERQLPKEKNKKVTGLMKDKIGGKIMTEFIGFGAKTHSYLIDDISKDKKAKGTKRCVIKRNLKFEDYQHCLEVTQLENKENVH